MTGETPEQPPKNPLVRDLPVAPEAPLSDRVAEATLGRAPAPARDPVPPSGTILIPRTLSGRHRGEDLERLLDISIELNALSDLDHLLFRILQAAKEMMKAEDASIMLLDADTGRLRFAAIDSPFRDALRGVSLNLGEGIAGWVALQGEVVIAEDAYSDPRFSKKGDAASGHRTANMICLPLKTPDRIIGTLQVINRLGGRYTPDDVPLCLSLANIAAIAIENVRLHETTERNLQHIRQLQEARAEFINLISHELRTPLTIIQGGLDILRSGMELDDVTRQDFLRSMAVNTGRLKRLVDDIFIVNDVEALRDSLVVREVDMVHLARVFDDFFEAETRAPRLRVEMPPDADAVLYTIRGDRERIIHCISHLLDNARKFSPHGGEVVLRVQRDETLHSLRVTVADQGIGIEPEAVERIFDRFYQVDSSLTRRYGGTGIGLFICRKVVEAHGGMIWCHSRVGVGSEFSFALPLES